MTEQNLSQIIDVVCALDETKGYKIDVFVSTKLNISQILRRQNITAEISVRQVQPLATHQETVVAEAHLDRCITDTLGHLAAKFTVKQINRLAHLHLVSEIVLNR